MSEVEININDVLQEMRTYYALTPDIEKKVRRAYEYAEDAHGKHGIDPITGELLGQPQRRKSGELYIQHPLHTALILAQYKLDYESIMTGLLHDVIEDTDLTEADVAKEFGEKVAQMCVGLAKLSKVRYHGDDREIQDKRRMFVAMAEDMRVIFVKLADRLHNMRTLDYVRVDKRARIAKETLEIFAPLAYRLGIFDLKSELENLCFKYLYPVDYLALSSEMKKMESGDRVYLEKVRQELLKIMAEEGIVGRVEGRIKHLYSIYKKMKKKNAQLDEIYDRLALRVVVTNKRDCYALLGAVHSRWQVMLGRFKDYIALPKINGYQSLHTVVFPFRGEERRPTEIQIRTERMHKEAEYGLAAHWMYSEHDKEASVADERHKQWVKVLQQIKQETQNTEFSKGLSTDLLENRIFVFTPHGEVVDLPKGATPVDFAFAVHSEIGLKCRAAKVDGKVISLDSDLHNGQTVEIITATTAQPSHYWLSFVKTSNARNKIRQFLRERDRDKNIAAGKEIIKKESGRYGFVLPKRDNERRERALEGTPYETYDDLLAAVGESSFSKDIVLRKLFAEEFAQMTAQKESKAPVAKKPTSQQIVVEGVDGSLSGMKVGTRACCGNNLGDRIVGYITRGKGIAIHRADCPAIKNAEPSRLVTAYFEGQRKFYHIKLAVFTDNRVGVFRKAISIFVDQGIDLTRASFYKGDDIIKYEPPANAARVLVFEFKIDDIGRLQQIFDLFTNLKGVFDIKRLD